MKDEGAVEAVDHIFIYIRVRVVVWYGIIF